MATFLQLCQDTAKDSGTVPNYGQPSTVVGQENRLGRIVGWVNEAWQQIQNERDDWRWMIGEFSGNTIASTQRYDAASMGIDATRFSHWVWRGEGKRNLFSVYKTADGVADEGYLEFKDYENFYHDHMIGTQESGKPQVFSVDYADNLIFYKTPDADYTIRGRYKKAPQTLSANTDVPEFPAQYHNLIKWRALMLLAVFDESFTQYPVWERNANKIMNELEKKMLPRMRLGGPLA